MDSDWERYEADGTNTYYMVCNVILMVLPFPLYAAALMTLFRRQAEKTISKLFTYQLNRELVPKLSGKF